MAAGTLPRQQPTQRGDKAEGLPAPPSSAFTSLLPQQLKELSHIKTPTRVRHWARPWTDGSQENYERANKYRNTQLVSAVIRQMQAKPQRALGKAAKVGRPWGGQGHGEGQQVPQLVAM